MIQLNLLSFMEFLIILKNVLLQIIIQQTKLGSLLLILKPQAL